MGCEIDKWMSSIDIFWYQIANTNFKFLVRELQSSFYDGVDHEVDLVG